MTRPPPSPAPRPRRDHRAGITLLELLVSMSMMAVLALILGSTLDQTARGMGRLGEEADGLGLLLDRAALRRWIEEMPAKADFAGGAEGLSFETLLDEPPFWAGELAQISLGRSGDGADAAIRAVATASDGSIGRTFLLSPTSVEFTLAYWGSYPGAPPGWQADWPEGVGLPELVRIGYDFEGRPLPPLSVRPARAARQSAMSLSSLLPPG